MSNSLLFFSILSRSTIDYRNEPREWTAFALATFGEWMGTLQMMKRYSGSGEPVPVHALAFDWIDCPLAL